MSDNAEPKVIEDSFPSIGAVFNLLYQFPRAELLVFRIIHSANFLQCQQFKIQINLIGQFCRRVLIQIIHSIIDNKHRTVQQYSRNGYCSFCQTVYNPLKIIRLIICHKCIQQSNCQIYKNPNFIFSYNFFHIAHNCTPLLNSIILPHIRVFESVQLRLSASSKFLSTIC